MFAWIAHPFFLDDGRAFAAHRRCALIFMNLKLFYWQYVLVP